jgi:hypothetical protein
MMTKGIHGALFLMLAGPLLSSCYTHVPAAMAAWSERVPTLAPPGANGSGDIGYLRVETDTDLRIIGRDTYYNVRRPYDIYTADGKLLAADVDNGGGRSGEEPRLVPHAPGRYVIASVYGATYRKVQIEVRPGVRTDVPQNALQEAPRVFPH